MLRTSRCWMCFQETLFCCLCCFRTKRSSVEKILEFSGTKWNTQGLEPVIVHDILSNDILDIQDSNSLEVAAMMHGAKDDGDPLNSSSELCLEDGADPGDVRIELQDYVEEWKGYGIFPSNEAEAGGTTEKVTDQEIKKKAPLKEEDKDDEEEKSHSGTSGEE